MGVDEPIERSRQAFADAASVVYAKGDGVQLEFASVVQLEQLRSQVRDRVIPKIRRKISETNLVVPVAGALGEDVSPVGLEVVDERLRGTALTAGIIEPVEQNKGQDRRAAVDRLDEIVPMRGISGPIADLPLER